MSTLSSKSPVQTLFATIRGAFRGSAKPSKYPGAMRRHLSTSDLRFLSDRMLKDIGYDRQDTMSSQSRSILQRLMNNQLW
jgi:uncharacterized protein YjiS (DUF1127 family)